MKNKNWDMIRLFESINKTKVKGSLKENDDYDPLDYIDDTSNDDNSDPQPSDDLIDYDVPDWSLSALINGDYSGLSDEDEVKLNAFVDRVVQKHGNAHFMINDPEGKDDLGFRPSNDIDNLGSNVVRVYIRPSNNDSGLDKLREYGLKENINDDPTKNEMIAHLKQEFGNEYDEFDAEEAIYWFGNDYHGGQWSNLYSALSTSEYKPSSLMKEIPSDGLSKMMYDSLVSKFG